MHSVEAQSEEAEGLPNALFFLNYLIHVNIHTTVGTASILEWDEHLS